MNMRLIKIRPENVVLAWADARPFLEKALEHANDYSMEYIYNALIDDKIVLWMYYDDDTGKAQGAMLTEVQVCPRNTLMIVFLLGANDFDKNVVPVFDDFIKHAKDSEVDAIEVYCRLGFEPKLKKLGFDKTYILMRKELE